MKSSRFSVTPEVLLNAYAAGIFPMAESRDDPELFWVDPRRRGILPLERFHISRSLARRMRRGGYDVRLNEDFRDIIAACADREDTWINQEISDLYHALFMRGQAHCLGIYHDNALTGGIYGVSLGAAFFGESMFSRCTDGSKLAMAHLVDHLRRCRFRLFDTQFITSHLSSLGAAEISRAAYHLLLEEAIQHERSVFEVPLDTDPQSVLQRSTQTSYR